MTTPELTGSDRRDLRAQGQLIPDQVTIGHQGITAPLQKEVDGLLTRHQLIKIRATELDRKVRKALFEQMAEISGSALVSTVGRTALLYRPNPDLEKS